MPFVAALLGSSGRCARDRAATGRDCVGVATLLPPCYSGVALILPSVGRRVRGQVRVEREDVSVRGNVAEANFGPNCGKRSDVVGEGRSHNLTGRFDAHESVQRK